MASTKCGSKMTTIDFNMAKNRTNKDLKRQESEMFQKSDLDVPESRNAGSGYLNTAE